MSTNGQHESPIRAAVLERDLIARPVVALASDYPPGHRIAPHAHRKAQLLHAAGGGMVVRTQDAAWVVPPGLALWMPPGTVHAVDALGTLRMRTLYVDPEHAAQIANEVRVVEAPPLLHELILAAVEVPPLYDEGGPDGRLMAVLLDRLRLAADAPLKLPMPRDRRLAPIARTLLDDPGDERTLEEWAAQVGASPRTLARRFRTDTGLGFREWRQRRLLLAALERLTAGEPVTSVALDLGYASPSAFVAMFRRALGAPPARYLRAARR